MNLPLTNDYKTINDYKKNKLALSADTLIVPSAQNCLLSNSDFSAAKRFRGEPPRLLQRSIAWGKMLFNSSRAKLTQCLNHVDLIIVYLMTTQCSQANVLATLGEAEERAGVDLRNVQKWLSLNKLSLTLQKQNTF